MENNTQLIEEYKAEYFRVYGYEFEKELTISGGWVRGFTQAKRIGEFKEIIASFKKKKSIPVPPPVQADKEVVSNGGHTPGPWELQGPKIQKDFGDQTYWTIKPNPYKSKADPYICIGFFYPYSGNSEEQQAADADLITSAPQLKVDNETLKSENNKLRKELADLKERITEALNNNPQK